MTKAKGSAQPTEYLTKAQVAELLHVSQRTVNRLTAKGYLTVIRPRLGRRVFYDKAEALALSAEVITPSTNTEK